MIKKVHRHRWLEVADSPRSRSYEKCHVKGCNSNNFPLQLSDVEIEIQETDFNPKFLRNMLSKLEWNALVKTALEVFYLLFPNILS